MQLKGRSEKMRKRKENSKNAQKPTKNAVKRSEQKRLNKGHKK